tara:strand:- start:937 stop:1134 length:198 start_codon:yes stop_codon:yes gene_type:complete
VIQIQRHPDSTYEVFSNTGKCLGVFERVYEKDGQYYYIPRSRQIYSAALLKALANKLEEVNKKWK